MAHLERQRALSPAVGWWALQLCLTVVACAQMWLSQLSIDSCTEASCDYTDFAATLNAFFIGALFLLLASAAGIVLLRRSGRQPALAPILGILLLIAWLAVAYASSRAALQLPLFGNRL